MNTKLLIAASATALLGFAGAASAIDLSLTNVTTTANVNDVAGGAVRSLEAHRYVASEVSGAIFADPATAPGGVYSTWVEARLLPSVSAVMPNGNALLTFELSGAGATFRSAAVAAGNIIQDGQAGVPAGGTCAPTRSVVSIEPTKVVYLVSALTGCDAANPIDVVLPVNFSSSTANVTLSSSFVTEGPGTPIDNVAPANMLNRPVITFIDGYQIAVTAAGAPALVADVTTTPAYLTFENVPGTTQSVGTAALGVRTTLPDGITPIAVAVNIDGAANLVSTAHYSNPTDFLLTATSGGFTGLKASIEGQLSEGPIIAGTAYPRTVAAATVAGSGYDIEFRVADTGAAVVGGQPAATGVPIQGATFSGRASTVVSVPAVEANTTNPVTFTEVGEGGLKPVTLGGTNFVAPWVSISGGSSPQLRLSNAINAPSGAIELTALSWTGGAPTRITCTLGDFVPAKATIPANGAINIVRADFQACFGTAVTNADIRVTIRSNVNGLGAKLRVQDSSGDTFEQTLGSLTSYRSAGGASNGVLTSQ